KAKQLQQSDALFPRAAKALREGQRAEAALERALAASRQAAEEYQRRFEGWMRAQAGVLAERLQPLKPCPVCGSLHHPSPARRDDGAPDEAQVKQAQNRRDAAEAQASAAAAEAARARQAICQARASVAEAVDLPEMRDWCAERGRTMPDVGRWRAASEENALEVMDGADFDERTLLELQALCRAFAAELERGAREDQSAAERAEAARRGAETRLEQAKAAQKELERQLELQTRLLRQAEVAFKNAIAQQGFISGRDYRDACAPEADAARWQRQLEEFDGQLALLTHSVTEKRQKWQGVEAVDTQAARGVLQGMDDTCQRLDREIRQLELLHAKNGDYARQLAACRVELDRAQAEYAVLDDLWRTAQGGVAGASKITFENYILQYYFRRVVAAANRRLTRMSDGRFYLADQNRAGEGNRRTGLDLDVMDNQTGRQRDVHTLSGGESFLASLSLALGFSDVVQSSAGGIRLDTLFIDEGFGTLDDETLSRAIGVLQNLADGNCLVGIISHVNALKQRIDRRLTIEKRPDGSHIRQEEA
ncbi:MAG: SbcC/MukB-like Walker B domain-containing protein, partial [Clostridia bacterium]|nr:SbcC/MukB-like Walker B domain-containing protein [Clostridia bacterium]